MDVSRSFCSAPKNLLLEHWKDLPGVDLMPGGGLATSPGTPGQRGLQGHLPVCPWVVAARTSRTRSERGCKGFGIFGWRAGARLNPAPEGELLSPAAIVSALCTQGNGRLYCPKRTKWHQAPWQRDSCHPWEMVLLPWLRHWYTTTPSGHHLWEHSSKGQACPCAQDQ